MEHFKIYFFCQFVFILECLIDMKKYSKILRKQNARISIIKPFSFVPVLTNCLLLNELAWRLTPLSDEFSSPELFFNFFILNNHWNDTTVQFIDIMKNWIEKLKLKKYFKQGFSISAYSSYSFLSYSLNLFKCFGHHWKSILCFCR